MDERIWRGLGPVAAAGRGCVICRSTVRAARGVWLPVGRSQAGSPVFACAGACAETAMAPGAVLITEDALAAAAIAFLAALDTAGGDLSRAYPDDLVTATVTAAAPLIVAAELRRLAASGQVQHWESAVRVMVALLPVADLRTRAAALEPAGMGEPEQAEECPDPAVTPPRTSAGSGSPTTLR